MVLLPPQAGNQAVDNDVEDIPDELINQHNFELFEPVGKSVVEGKLTNLKAKKHKNKMAQLLLQNNLDYENNPKPNGKDYNFLKDFPTVVLEYCAVRFSYLLTKLPFVF